MLFVLNLCHENYQISFLMKDILIIEPVTIGVYTPPDDSYSVVDTIENASICLHLVVHAILLYRCG